MQVKRVGVLSCGKVAGLLYGAIGLLVGGLFSLFSLVGFAIGSAQGKAEEAVIALFFGVGAVIVMPVIYGAMAFIFACIGAIIYNVIAGIAGGIEVELE